MKNNIQLSRMNEVNEMDLASFEQKVTELNDQYQNGLLHKVEFIRDLGKAIDSIISNGDQSTYTAVNEIVEKISL